MPYFVRTIQVGPVKGPVVMDEKGETVAGPFTSPEAARERQRQLNLQEAAKKRTGMESPK
jgi:hypothetical protein